MFCESAVALRINLGTNWIRNRGDLMLRWELCRILMRDYDRSHVKSADILRPATPQQLLVSVAIALLGHQRRLFLSNPLEIRPYNHTFHLTLTFLPFFFIITSWWDLAWFWFVPFPLAFVPFSWSPCLSGVSLNKKMSDAMWNTCIAWDKGNDAIAY